MLEKLVSLVTKLPTLLNHKAPTVTQRPWGFFSVLLQGNGYWLKRLSFNYGRTSLQSHTSRNEYWLIFVPKGVKHRIGGKGDILELALGSPCEQDISRYADDYNRLVEPNTIVITSGFYNPCHPGHLQYLNDSKNLGDYHIAIVNNDKQVAIKGSVPFMNQEDRFEIVKNIRSVDKVILSIDEDITVCKTLEKIRQLYPDKALIFSKGGDRLLDNIPEKATCEQHNIKMVFNVGGEKTQSSSNLLSKVKNGS